MLAEIADGLDLNSEPPETGDFGFYYPIDTVRLAVTILKASNYQCWPDPGGMLDQDSRMLSDIMQYISLERRVEFEQKAIDASIEGKRDEDPAIVTEDMFR